MNQFSMALSIIAIIISFCVLYYQIKQNYLSNIFQMITVFQNQQNDFFLPTKENIPSNDNKNSTIKVDKDYHGNEVIKFLLRIIQDPPNHSATVINHPSKEKLNTEELHKIAFLEIKGIFASKIDSMVIQALMIKQYIDNGFSNPVSKIVLRAESINYDDRGLSFNKKSNLAKDSIMLIDFFRSTIYKEFKLIVLLFYVYEKDNDIYRRFMSKEYFGMIENEHFDYYTSSNKYLQDMVEKAIKELS